MDINLDYCFLDIKCVKNRNSPDKRYDVLTDAKKVFEREKLVNSVKVEA